MQAEQDVWWPHLPTHKTKFWGREYSVSPAIVEEVHGDGLQIIGFQFMDDRPMFYVLAVDSKVDAEELILNNESIEEWVFSAIENQYGWYFDEDEEDFEDKPHERRFPYAPTDPVGHCWWEYEPDSEEMVILNSVFKKTKEAANAS